jgi:hypothetical protein
MRHNFAAIALQLHSDGAAIAMAQLWRIDCAAIA